MKDAPNASQYSTVYQFVYFIINYYKSVYLNTECNINLLCTNFRGNTLFGCGGGELRLKNLLYLTICERDLILLLIEYK